MFLKINIRIDKIGREDLPLQIYSNRDARRKPLVSRPCFVSTSRVIRNQAYRHSKAIVPGNLQDHKRLDDCYRGSKQLAPHHTYALRVFSYASLLTFPALHMRTSILRSHFIIYNFQYYIYFRN